MFLYRLEIQFAFFEKSHQHLTRLLSVLSKLFPQFAQLLSKGELVTLTIDFSKRRLLHIGMSPGKRSLYRLVYFCLIQLHSE